MASQRYLQGQLVDPVDGLPATKNIKFWIDEREFSVRVGEATLRAYMDVVGPLAEAVREKERLRRNELHAPGTAAHIRAWARKRGIDLNERGRIPDSVRQDYEDSLRRCD